MGGGVTWEMLGNLRAVSVGFEGNKVIYVDRVETAVVFRDWVYLQ